MTNSDRRSVNLDRTARGRYRATNVRGASISIGTGDGDDFTPVELLLAAIAGCAAIDLDLVVGKRSEPTDFRVEATGDKGRDELGNRLVDLAVEFSLGFDDGEPGDAAWDVVPRTLEQIRTRLCTVSRTVAVGTPVRFTAER